MQITRLHIENFKGIDRLDISFLEEGTNRPRPLTMLLGDNGSGETTVLQVIALVLSLATRKAEEPSSFDWPGFMAERVSSRGPTVVELDVRFDPEELNRRSSMLSGVSALTVSSSSRATRHISRRSSPMTQRSGSISAVLPWRARLPGFRTAKLRACSTGPSWS
jgi:predicted ATPase